MSRHDIVKGLKEELRELADQRRQLDRQEKDLEKALSLVEGPGAQNGPEPAQRKRKKGRRVPFAVRRREAREVLMAHPNEHMTSRILAQRSGMPQTTALAIMRGLAADGEVKQVGLTPRGGPIVVYKETTVHAGEGELK